MGERGVCVKGLSWGDDKSWTVEGVSLLNVDVMDPTKRGGAVGETDPLNVKVNG